MSRYFGIPLRNGLPLGLGAVATLRSGGASGPVNSATDWYFAQLGLTGTPWADVSRTGLGTRVDSAGLVRQGPHNLIQQSENVSAAIWSKAQSATTPDAETIVFAALPESRVEQSGAALQLTQIGDSATVQVEMRADVPMQVNLSAGGDRVYTTVNVTTQWQRFTATRTRTGAGTENVFAIIANVGSAAGTVKVRRIGINLGPTAFDYIPTTSSARYLPRLTWDPVTLSPLGLLVEGQAANEIGSHSLASPQMVTQTITVTAAQRTLSFYGTGTVTLSGAHSATVVGTGAYPSRRTLTFTPSAGSLTLTVSGTVQFPQQETGSVATSYIPNPGSGSAVRVADDWFLSGSALDAALGAARNNFTIYVEWFEPAGALVGNPRVMYLGTTDYSRRVDVYRNGSGVTVFVADGVGSTTIAQSPANAGALNKLAISADGTNVRFVLNGSAGATLASAFGGAAMAARLLLLHAPGSSWMNTYVPAARAYPGRAMSIAEMQALTA